MFDTPPSRFAPITSYPRKKKPRPDEEAPPPDTHTEEQEPGLEQGRDAAMEGLRRRFERAPEWRRGRGADAADWRTTMARPADRAERRNAVDVKGGGDGPPAGGNGARQAAEDEPTSYFERGVLPRHTIPGSAVARPAALHGNNAGGREEERQQQWQPYAQRGQMPRPGDETERGGPRLFAGSGQSPAKPGEKPETQAQTPAQGQEQPLKPKPQTPPQGQRTAQAPQAQSQPLPEAQPRPSPQAQTQARLQPQGETQAKDPLPSGAENQRQVPAQTQATKPGAEPQQTQPPAQAPKTPAKTPPQSSSQPQPPTQPQTQAPIQWQSAYTGTPGQQSAEDDPKVAEALKHAQEATRVQMAREQREAELAELEAKGMAKHASTLRDLDAEMARRRADMEKRHPDHGAEYEAGVRELEKEKNARQAQVMEEVRQYKARDRVDDLRAAGFVVSRESKVPYVRGKTAEQRQAEWEAQMKRAGLDPNNQDHMKAYWDAKQLHFLNSGKFARSGWDGSPLKRQGFGSAVLSDGSLHVAPEFIHDAKKYAAVVAASGASPEEKALAMALLPRLQVAYAEALLPVLKRAGDTRAAQWIPGIASFQKWQSEKPRQGTEAEQANEYLKEMNKRGMWSKATDNVLRSLLVGFGDMATMTMGLAGMVGIPGASEKAADWAQRGSDFLAPISAEGGNSGTTSAIFGHVARMAGPMAATLLITRGLGGGVGTMSALSGAQTAGSQYAETYGRLREQGKTHFQAWLSTAPFALGSGLATAFLTAAGGRTGFEAALGGTRAAAREAAQGYWKNLLSNVPKHALADLPQELPDELFSQISSALATGDDVGRVVGEFFRNSHELMGAIMLMGGAGGAMGTHQQVNDSIQEAQIQLSSDGNAQDGAQGTPGSGPQIPENTTSESQDSGQSRAALGRPSTPPLSVEKSQKLIHHVMDRPAEQRAHPTTQADLAQAQWVVREQVRRLEGQKEPLSEAQQKELAEAREALARVAPPGAQATATQSSSGSLPPGASATPNSDAPPTGIQTDAPPAGSSRGKEPSVTSATWSTGGEDSARSATATTNSAAPPDLATAGKAMDTVKALRKKGGKITLGEALELDQAEKAVASAIKANLEKKKGVTGALSERETNALNAANATLARHAPRDSGPLPAIPDARRTIQDLSGKAAAGGTLSADEAHQLAHAQRAIAQERVSVLAAAEASGTLSDAQRRQLDRFREILDASPYGTELPKGPPPGYDPHATNAAHREWYPPHGEKPVHPTDDKFTAEALAIPDDEVKSTVDRLKEEGHAHERHGPGVTEGQLADRSMHGIDPITQTREDGVKRGQDHSYSGNATQFTSDRAMVQSLKAVEGSHEFHLKLKLAEAHNASNPGKPRPQFVVKGVSLEKALGPQYDKHVRGVSRKGTAAAPTGSESMDFTNGKVMAVYRYNRSTGKYQLHTMYPDPK